jgi:anaerobic ribonucleoside-triphosphate reductase activating protein
LSELLWIIDPATGDLVVEGLEAEEATSLAGEFLDQPKALNCARPSATPVLPSLPVRPGPVLRVHAIYHGSVVEGPGRRSVLQVRGCPLRCKGCFVPETHPFEGGVILSVDKVLSALLDRSGEPRDGVTVLGGEPFAQAAGLAALLARLKARGIHTTVYTGYTVEVLVQRADPMINAALELTDLLIDGPFVDVLRDNAGEWRGSRNQRLIYAPERQLQHDVVLAARSELCRLVRASHYPPLSATR